MKIAKWIFPDDYRGKQELYYRGGGRCSKGQLLLSAGECVSLDTYFNAFFYEDYRKYTLTDQIRVCLRTSGQMRVTLWALDRDGEQKKMAVLEVCGDRAETSFPTVELSKLSPAGALYVEAEAYSDGIIHEGWFSGTACESHSVHIAAVICTYHREKYVKRNLERIQSGFWSQKESGVSDCLDCLIVDNGKTIMPEDVSGKHVFLLPNKNYGGSGGFTRGLIEAYRRRNKYSHVLLMDDDISFEPEILARTIRFLKLIKPFKRPICIGGQMLMEKHPVHQYEAGGNFVRTRIKCNGQGVDLSNRDELLHNQWSGKAQYNAWWYCCFPLSEIERVGLPLPLFIKCDDLEYGLRMKPEVVLLNGIGVWHMDFAQKVSPYLEYYVKRNELIVSALHDRRNNRRNAIMKLIRACGKAAINGDTRNTHFILKAYSDFLKGPSFLQQTDEEHLNTHLIEENKSLKSCHPVHTIANCFSVLHMCISLSRHYRMIQKEYLESGSLLTCMDFWCTHLGIENVCNNNEMTHK